ncbi:hypothetical protein [Zavarzinia compransoris]|uniref:Uncharacterized protein n=1 Tax=Zavarzinia compransoris TaxID=1264899 RepID=A0A317DY67_9PROT|nr:hypothetical protein [Zavarzinia compransoris]PWR19677.1 hypothetical protein DKG75_14505 [Zavarzinia compransoris]TDP43379.1 hypothetical protein DES42_11280 [Zavarzinia compransoris]
MAFDRRFFLLAGLAALAVPAPAAACIDYVTLHLPDLAALKAYEGPVEITMTRHLQLQLPAGAGGLWSVTAADDGVVHIQAMPGTDSGFLLVPERRGSTILHIARQGRPADEAVAVSIPLRIGPAGGVVKVCG